MDGREADDVNVDRTYDDILGAASGFSGEDGIPVGFWEAG
jgi:hypothetical protein